MGYDEHTAASEEAGSVASLDFVVEGIEKTLEEVPKEKIVNALPFYVRYWIVDDNENILDMQTLTMTKGLETVTAAGAVPEWNEASGQNYAEWKTPEGTNKIWLEDIKSIQAKLDVMKAHDIGGVAVWQLAFGTEEAFQIIDEYYK
jgi:spore germination protein YaaH